MSDAGIDNSSAKMLPVGTVSMALYGATIGKLGMLGIPAATNQACANCVIHEAVVDRWYTFYYLLHQRQALTEAGQGGAQPNLSNQIVREWPLALAPLAEQKRIVAKVEELLGRVKIVRERLAKVPGILKRFRQAVLAAACSGRLTEDWREPNGGASVEAELQSKIRSDKKLGQAFAKGERFKTGIPFDWDLFPALPSKWCWGAAAEVVAPDAEIVYGIVQPGPEAPDGVPYVRGLDIQEGKILVGQLRRTSHAIAKRYERASLKGGDVLLGIIRNTKVAIVPEELGGGNITQGTARLRPSKLISTGFLAVWLESRYAQDWLHMHYRGIDMPGLNLADVRRLPVALPPAEEQHEIVRRVEALLKLADAIEKRVAAAMARADKLTQSILAKAFRGELVPTEAELARAEGRDYEPASVLLERIRKEREKSVEVGGKRRKASRRGTIRA